MSSSSSSTTTRIAPISQNLTSLSLGYAIAVTFAFLVLLSTILLAFYICCRATRPNHPTRTSSRVSSDAGIIVPRFIFVADDSSDSTSVGLDHAVINSYPKFPFSSPKLRTSSCEQSSACSICLCEYKEAEMLRMMPDCKHFFHLTCLDAWLRLNGSCPVCRNSPLPTPVSTPLAEVVPLSQYAADRTRTPWS